MRFREKGCLLCGSFFVRKGSGNPLMEGLDRPFSWCYLADIVC